MYNWINGNLTGKLSVGQGERGKSLEYMWRGIELGIRQEGEEEYQFVNLAGNNGSDGREIELQVNNGYIQWRYVGEESWNNLVELSALEGKQGIQGVAGKDGVTPDMSGFENKINKQYETIEKKIDDHIENHPQGSGDASIDDTTITTDKTWSSSKISDFVLTNDDVVWSTVQGENLSIDYTKEGYLREFEIWGNTIQNEEDLSNIQHLGELYVDEKGQPILDSENRKQYKIDIESVNKNLIDEEMEEGGIDSNTGKPKQQVGKCRSVKFTRINRNTDYYLKAERYSNKAMWTGAFLYDYNFKFIKLILNNGVNYVKFNSGEGMYIKTAAHVPPSDIHSVILEKGTISTNYIPHKSSKTTLLLPCQLMKISNISDRLYWDKNKGRYIIEKKVDIPEGYDKLIDKNLVLQTPEIIDTNITKEILLPCYKDKTHLFHLLQIDGIIKAKAPVDGGKAIQSLSTQNTALTLENEEMKTINKEQDELINTTMLATDEMYMMLEPLLAETLSERSVSKMVDMYVAMVQRGIKTIEQIPVRYREQVKKILDQLEK